MDTDALLQPQIRDNESLQDFYDSLSDHIPVIERYVAQLKRTPSDKVLIADLFRALHNIKGDAALCKIDYGAIISHPIETLLGRMRSNEIRFSELCAEAVLLAMDRLELATETLLRGQRSIAHLKLTELSNGLEILAEATPATLDEKAIQVIEAVTSFRPASVQPHIKPTAAATPGGTAGTEADLEFFRSLALQYEAHSPLFKGRSERQLHLALETNAIAGNPVNTEQLKAAVYMHDLGMMLLPESLWLKGGKLSDEDKRMLHTHVEFSAGLLKRMPDWQEAAEIVRQHHEMPDGKGYPSGLKGSQITPGAKILAMADTFEAVMMKHSQRGDTRSLIRAIAEINACNNQFEPEWIARFNIVVRRMVEG